MSVIATQPTAEPALADLAWFPTDRCFIDGRWVPPQSGARLPIEDPSRGIEIGSIARVRNDQRSIELGLWHRLTPQIERA